MAPEQIISARDADARSDVWSLGVILFRLISGKAPFHAASLGELIQQIMHAPIPNLREAKPDVPIGLEAVVARCLERDRNRRLGDVIELARLLAPYAGPVATPSLERIAILGPALVAVAPPPPQPSAPSLSSARSAWTAPPTRASALTDPGRKDLTPKTAALWGGVFVAIVGVTAVMVARIAGQSHETTAPAITTTAVGFDTASGPLTAASLDPSAAGLGSSVVTTADTAVPAVSVVTPPPTASPARPAGHGNGSHARPRPGSAPRPDGTKPSGATTATAGIPETRE
jgi:serine/threonine-protein kinase